MKLIGWIIWQGFVLFLNMLFTIACAILITLPLILLVDFAGLFTNDETQKEAIFPVDDLSV